MKRTIHPDAQVLADFYLGNIQEIQCRQRGADALWITINHPSGSMDQSYREKPKEPEWMPEKGDWVIASSGTGSEHKRHVLQFCLYLDGADSPWRLNGIHEYVHVVPFPLQQERNAYRKLLSRILNQTMDASTRKQVMEMLEEFPTKSTM